MNQWVSSVDVSCPLASHPLNSGLVGEWAALPRVGYPRSGMAAAGNLCLRDLVVGKRFPHHLYNFSSGTQIFRAGSLGRPGGYGSVNFTATGGTDIYNSDTLTVAAPFSIGMWFYVNSFASGFTLVSTRQPSDNSFDWQITNSTTFHSDIGNGSSWITTSADATVPTMATKTWYHGMYVVTSAGYRIFFNGKSVGSGSFSGSPIFANSTHTMNFGKTSFSGALDGITLHNRELSTGEVYDFYAESKLGNPNRWNWVSDYPAVFAAPTVTSTLFRQTPMNGLGVGGPFFANPLV